MAIKIGNLDINAFKLGSGDTTIYLGDTLLYPTTPPTPSFDGKWKATYSDSHVESAECGSSSEIVSGEINLSNLVSAEIGDCVTSIDFGAFDNCYSLSSCTIGSSVTSIGGGAFNYCSSLTSVNIPSGVTSIGTSAFNGCNSITSMIVNSNNIFYDSRNNCNGIINTFTNTLIAGCKNTVIPNSVTSIGFAAFTSCSSLTSVTIPDSVTSIEVYAFADCTGLTSIDIPSGVTSIEQYAFRNCSSLSSITVNSIVPPALGYEAFMDTSSNLVIYVPSGSVNAYKSASGWSEYASQIEPIPNS